MIIIGSQALKYWYPNLPREPKDLDVILHDGETEKSLKLVLNYSKIEFLENPILLKWHKQTSKYLSPDMLLTLKASHIFWDINWEKHIFDIQFLNDKGHRIIKDLFYELYDFWNNYHSKNKRSDLKMTSADFFDNAVKCKYDHDFLHTLLKETPTYTKILKDGEDVDVSEEKFEKLTFDEKCSLVQEEVYVMAYERLFKREYRHAYSWMLKKFIISHAPIWEAIFIIENFKHLYKPKFNYVQQINSKLEELCKLI